MNKTHTIKNKMNKDTSDHDRAVMTYDIWPHLSALSRITPNELSDILRSEFTVRQVKSLRRELGRLRRAYTNQLAPHDRLPK